MERKTKQEVDRLLSRIDEPENEAIVGEAMIVDPMLALKQTLLRFFSDRLERITEKETFLRKIQAAIEEKIDEGGLKISELLDIFRVTSGEMNMATESILSLFRPSKDGVVTPLLTGEQQRDNMGDAFGNLSTKDLETIDKLRRLIEAVNRKE